MIIARPTGYFNPNGRGNLTIKGSLNKKLHRRDILNYS
jgi:hypothetical protein